MSRFIKQGLTILLFPLVWLLNRLSGAARLLSFARVRYAIGGKIDPSTVVLGCPEMHGTKNIEIGAEGYLYRELYLETRENGRIEIGNGVVISRGVHLVSFAEIILEEGVMIGEYSSVRDANHRRYPGESVRRTGHISAPIRVERNAWIGRGVTVLPGVTIGAGAVVGANAVVTKNVPPDSTVAGVPARSVGSH